LRRTQKIHVLAFSKQLTTSNEAIGARTCMYAQSRLNALEDIRRKVAKMVNALPTDFNCFISVKAVLQTWHALRNHVCTREVKPLEFGLLWILKFIWIVWVTKPRCSMLYVP